MGKPPRAPLLMLADAEWVLDVYFAHPDALAKHELARLVIALPPKAARAESTSGNSR